MRDELEQQTGLDTMTKAELKAEARARGLPTTGTKAALLERVEQHDSEADGDGGAEADTGETDDQSGTRARNNGADEGDAEEPEPSAEDGEATHSLLTPRAAASGIWRLRPMLNLMLEAIVQWVKDNVRAKSA